MEAVPFHPAPILMRKGNHWLGIIEDVLPHRLSFSFFAGREDFSPHLGHASAGFSLRGP
ncbi:MAG: hypothetical protein U0Q16_10265 [Bryobacteraceae bacterium]